MLRDGNLAVLITGKVGEKLSHRLSKGFIQRIFVELVDKELNLIGHTVHTVSVTLTQQEAAFSMKFVPFRLALFLNSEALLFQTFSGS